MMKVLLSEGPSLEERVRKNMPFLGRKIEPVQFFHDISPVLHEMDEMRLQRALERDIPPMLFHKIWEAVRRRIGWEETFIEALRQQRNPQLLHVLGLYVENAAPQQQPVMHQARGVLAASPENYSYYNASSQRQYCSPQVPLNYAPGSDTAACYLPEESSPAIHDQKLAMQSIQSPECREKAKTESVKAITACLLSQHQGVALLRRTSHTPQNVDGREVLQAGFHGLPAGVTSEDRLRSPMGTTNTQFVASDNRQRSPLGTSAQFARQCQGAAPTHNPAHFPLPSPPPAAVAVGPPPSPPLQNFRGHQGRCMEPQGRYPDNIPVSIVDNAAQDQSISGTSGHSASKPQSSPLQDANVRQAAYAEIENLRPDEECLHHHHVTADSEELQPDADFSDHLAQQTMPPQSWSTTSAPLASRQASGADEPRPRMERHLTREASISDSQAVNININKLILNGPTAFGSKNTAQSIVGAMERESTQREGSFTHGVQVEAAGTNLAHLSAGTAADDGQHLLTESESAGRMPSRESRPVLHNPVAESQSESDVPYPSDASESVRLSSVLFSETDRPADEMMTLKPPAEHFPIVRTDSYSSGVQEPGNPPSLHLPRDDPRHQTSAKTARNDLTDCLAENSPADNPGESTHVSNCGQTETGVSFSSHLSSTNLEEDTLWFSGRVGTDASAAALNMPRRSSDNPDLYKFGEGTLSTSQMNPKDVRHAQNQTDGTNAATTASSAFPTAHLKACPKGQNARSYDQVTPDLTGDKLSAEKPVQESASCESLASPRDQAHVTDQDPEAGACSADGGCDERNLDEQAVRSGDRAISDNSTATDKARKDVVNKCRRSRRRGGRKKLK